MVKHQATKSAGDTLLASEWNAEHVLTSGLDADKPASGLAVGQLYWATDTKILYRATSATTWEEILRGETVSRLAQLSEKSHSSLSGVTADQHHPKIHASSHVDGGADEITNKLDFRAMNIIAVRAIATSSFSTTSTTPVDVTGLSLNITLPQTANVLVGYTVYAVKNSGGSYTVTYQQFVRGGTAISYMVLQPSGDNEQVNGSMQSLDTGVLEGTYTYKLQGWTYDGTSSWMMSSTTGHEGRIWAIAFKY